MTTSTAATEIPRNLEYLPIGLFGSVMGLTGLSVAWKQAHALFGAPLWAAEAIAAVSVLVFVTLLLGYGVKLMSAPDRVLAEFRHPIAGNLFGTVLISLLLQPIVVAQVNLLTARILWTLGAIGMVLFAWAIESRWMSDRQQMAHATPAWIVPVVGMLDVPLALPSLGLRPLPEVMALSLAVGLFFAVPLFTLIFSRLVFEAPMPEALQPSLLILVAPFSVGFSSYVVTMGQVDAVALLSDPVCVSRAAGTPAGPTPMLSLSRVLVGGEFPARRIRNCGAQICGIRPKLVHHLCRLGAPRSGNVNHRGTPGPHARRGSSGGTEDSQCLNLAFAATKYPAPARR